MRMNESGRWQHGAGSNFFGEILAKGLAVEVGHRASRWLSARRVAIETEIHDRFVAWDAQALRRHGVHYDETHRLEHLFDACGCTAFGSGGCFICRSVDARGYDSHPGRHVLSMTNFGNVTEPLWLIHT